jgi:hypothetical protein
MLIRGSATLVIVPYVDQVIGLCGREEQRKVGEEGERERVREER